MDKEKYDKIHGKVLRVTDLLGKHIDKGIIELITLLNYHNIGTNASCWGHPNWGDPYPWVSISTQHLGNILEIVSELKITVEYFDECGDILI